MFLLLFQLNILLSSLVNVSEQVYAGLVLSVPLLLSDIPLLRVFISNKFVDHSFISLGIRFSLKCKFLYLDGFFSMRHFSFLFSSFNTPLIF